MIVRKVAASFVFSSIRWSALLESSFEGSAAPRDGLSVGACAPSIGWGYVGERRRTRDADAQVLPVTSNGLGPVTSDDHVVSGASSPSFTRGVETVNLRAWQRNDACGRSEYRSGGQAV